MSTTEEQLAELKAVSRPNTFVFTGHVYPERYQWTMQPTYEAIILHHDGRSSLVKISLTMSQVIVTAHTNSTEDALEMKNRITRSARNLADSLGFVTAAALDIEIISCITPDGTHHVFNTAFDGLLDHDPGTPESTLIFNELIAHADRSGYIRMALADLRSAIREPLDTCVNCYRAVESIRHEYLQGNADAGPARKASWGRMRDALDLPEEDLRWLEERATPRRHGRAIDVTGDERQRALRIARKAVQNHCLANKISAAQGNEIVVETSDDAPDG
jgi:hypothetical protein